MKRAMAFGVLCGGVLVSLSVVNLLAQASPATASAPVEWKLPPKLRLDPPRFRVTACQRFAIYAEELPSAQAADPNAPLPITYWVLEGAARQPKKILDLLPEEARKGGFEVRFAEPSPTGSSILVLGKMADRSQAVYAVNLGKNSVERIGQMPMLSAAWAGTQVAVAEADARQVRQLNIIEPFENKSNSLPIRGMIIAASSDATTFLILGDPNDLQRQIEPGRAGKGADLISASADGKVLRRLTAAQNLGQLPVFSPRGKYVAFLQNPASPREKKSIRVLAAAGSEDRTIDDFALVLAVTDSGEVITFGVGDTSDGTPVKFWDAKGASRVLVKAAQAATVAGGSVFYVTPGDAPVIRSAPIRD